MHETSAPVRPSLRRATLEAVRWPAAEAILGATIRASAASMNSLRVMAVSSLQVRCRTIIGSLDADELEQELRKGQDGHVPLGRGSPLYNRQTGLLTRWTEACRRAALRRRVSIARA